MPTPILTLENAGLRTGTGWLFRGLDLTIDARDRLALIGRNGVGKTTLLKLIAGELELDEGRRAVSPSVRVVRLQQDPTVTGFATLGDFARAGGTLEDHRIDSVADRLGVDLNREAATASGGERRRAALVRALAEQPDVLLLDEPTNHLDIDAIEWLENWLDRFNGGFVAISHDRAFLTRLTKASLWLDAGSGGGSLRRAEVGYGGFDAWSERIAEEEAKTASRLDARLRQEEHWLLRGVTARRKRNMGRLSNLIELRAERRAMTGPEGVARLATVADDTKTKVLIDAEHVSKAFDGRPILKDFSLRVRRGDRIGIVGPNGAGKSTLLKLLLGTLEADSGKIKRAASLDPTVIDQQRARLDGGKTVRDVLADGGDWLEVGGVRKHIAGHLKDFLFEPGVVDAPVESFSGGERSRLLLAREFAKPSNLLVLDEPTNDLDMETLDLLEEVLDDYAGTVLLVSHDRDFLDRVVTVTVALDGKGGSDVVVGGWSDWVAKRREVAAARAPVKTHAAPTAPKGKAVKLSFKDAHELKELPGQMEALHAAIAKTEAGLADAGLYTRDPKRFAALTAEHDRALAALAVAEERWLALAEKEAAMAS